MGSYRPWIGVLYNRDMTGLEMIEWFFLMLAADLIATCFVTIVERIKFAKPKRVRKSKKMAQVIQLKKRE